MPPLPKREAGPVNNKKSPLAVISRRGEFCDVDWNIMKIQIGNIRNQWTWCPSAGQRRGESFAVHGNGLDRHRDLFRDVRGGLTGGRVIGYHGIVGRKEQIGLIIQESDGCSIELGRVQVFICFVTEILNRGTVEGVGGYRRFRRREGRKIASRMIRLMY